MKKAKCLAAILAVTISMFMLVSVTATAEVPIEGGYAWIGGTFENSQLDEDGNLIDEWIEFEEYKIPFQIGVPFSVGLDFGSDTQTHLPAHWGGYIMVVQTDLEGNANNLAAHIEYIKVDGERIPFNRDDEPEVGFDRGIRVPITNGWASTPLVVSHERIGEFSTFEIVLAITYIDDDRPDFSAFADAPAPVEELTVEAVEEEVPAASSDDGGFPVWLIIVIAAAAAVIIIIIAVAKKKK
jgi:hypothetical protein